MGKEVALEDVYKHLKSFELSIFGLNWLEMNEIELELTRIL